MSRTQKALEKNLQSLTSAKPKKTTRKRKVKETEIKWTKSKDAKLFPWTSFSWRLEDRRENKVCHFQCYEHAEKYIRRYQLDKKEYKLQEHV